MRARGAPYVRAAKAIEIRQPKPKRRGHGQQRPSERIGIQPTGTVTFFADGSALGGAVTLTGSIVNQGGQPVQVYSATFTTSFFTLGVPRITAMYNVDANDLSWSPFPCPWRHPIT
jgi:hypothetical protein